MVCKKIKNRRLQIRALWFLGQWQNREELVMIQIILSNTSNAAIYEQIIAQIKDCIIKGEAAPDEALPSIRALASQLQISVITTKRAYEELEKEGLIYAKAGKGFYVAHSKTELLKEKRIQGLETQMMELIKQCKNAKLSKQDMMDMLEVLYDER